MKSPSYHIPYTINGGYGTTSQPTVEFKRIIRIFGTILLVIVLIEVSIFLLRDINTKTVVAKWGRIEKGYWAEALFLREETLLRAPLDGELVIEVDSGTRVPRGELLSYINAEMLSVNTSELNLQSRMELESLIRDEQAFRMDLGRIKSEIKELTQQSKRASRKSKNATAVLESLRREKARITELQKENHTKLVELRHKIHDQLEQQSLIMATEPGYLFYEYDGWEEEWNPGSFGAINEEDINRDFKLKKPGNKVQNGEVIGKIINPFRQVIMIIADVSKTGLPEPGTDWWMTIGNSLRPLKVLEINQFSGNKAILALEDISLPFAYLPNRRSKIFVIYRKTSGIMIPRRAIVIKDYLTQVKVLKGDGFELKNVRIVETDDHNAIIEGLEFGATIISR
jgi:putative membrane fusion protein